MAELLQIMGVPASAILQESGSRNTHENATLVERLRAAHHLRRMSTLAYWNTGLPAGSREKPGGARAESVR